jgi:ABC-type transporter Mla MlaB component
VFAICCKLTLTDLPGSGQSLPLSGPTDREMLIMNSPMIRKVVADTGQATVIYAHLLHHLATVQAGTFAILGHVTHEATCRERHS